MPQSRTHIPCAIGKNKRIESRKKSSGEVAVYIFSHSSQIRSYKYVYRRYRPFQH